MTLKKVFIWLPVVFMLMLIFGFSGQDGSQSGGLSRKAASVLIDAADGIGIINVTDDNRDTYIENMQFPIRKGAHMTEYAILGGFVYLALYVDGVRKKAVKYFSLILVFLFASADEFHQLFVPGRSGQFSDVLIDCTGCIIGLLLIELNIKRVEGKK